MRVPTLLFAWDFGLQFRWLCYAIGSWLLESVQSIVQDFLLLIILNLLDIAHWNFHLISEFKTRHLDG